MEFNLKSAVFLQCRLDSSRYPRKALLDLQGRTVIERAMEALMGLGSEAPVLLTTKEDYLELRPLAENYGFRCFAGPKEDVLDRFCKAAENYAIDSIIRATGDNPLVSGPLAKEILDIHLDEGNHYSAYLGIPLGTGVEILDSNALRKANQMSNDSYDHEHVAPFLYKNPEEFKVFRRDLSDRYGFSNEKISLDTPEDYERIKSIFKQLYTGSPIEIESIIACLGKENGN